jgi:hypothetical protein
MATVFKQVLAHTGAKMHRVGITFLLKAHTHDLMVAVTKLNKGFPYQSMVHASESACHQDVHHTVTVHPCHCLDSVNLLVLVHEHVPHSHSHHAAAWQQAIVEVPFLMACTIIVLQLPGSALLNCLYWKVPPQVYQAHWEVQVYQVGWQAAPERVLAVRRDHSQSHCCCPPSWEGQGGLHQPLMHLLCWVDLALP